MIGFESATGGTIETPFDLVGPGSAPAMRYRAEPTCLSPMSPGVIRQFLETGRFAEVVSFLRGQSFTFIEGRPELAVLYGIALARIGQRREGRHWVMTALRGATERGLCDVEGRSLNALGALAFEAGEMDEARENWLRARTVSTMCGDFKTIGRCSNNIGVLEDVVGRYPEALRAYTVAIASFERSLFPHGVSEAQHNIATTRRHQGNLSDSLEVADVAVEGALALQDTELAARAMAGRAEIRNEMGDGDMAVRDIEEALFLHRSLDNVVDEAEDLRILGLVVASSGDTDRAVGLLLDTISRARRFERPLLLAAARRDLARTLNDVERVDDAFGFATAAREGFEQLGAVVEVQKIDALIEQMRTRRDPA